jgi:hypothetical protein
MSDTIHVYHACNFGPMALVVKHTDHLAVVAEMRGEIDRLRQQLAEAKQPPTPAPASFDGDPLHSGYDSAAQLDAEDCPSCVHGQSLERGEGTHREGTKQHPAEPEVPEPA